MNISGLSGPWPAHALDYNLIAMYLARSKPYFAWFSTGVLVIFNDWSLGRKTGNEMNKYSCTVQIRLELGLTIYSLMVSFPDNLQLPCYMRSDNLQPPCVQSLSSSYNFQLPQ